MRSYLLLLALVFAFAAGEAGLTAFDAAFEFDAAFVFAAAGAAFVFAAGAGAGLELAAAAGRAPLSSFGFSTTFLARIFSIFASFIAIAW